MLLTAVQTQPQQPETSQLVQSELRESSVALGTSSKLPSHSVPLPGM